ncbi:transposase [Methylomarinovum caldicuralii]|uniref:Transposase n=1 Tax=Methylomarinovum caldicuralii TaxID=438856 RepID=A0AAU9CKC9_9GAMM|nr:transposase [Methylomarinovum caldicuralii]
MSPHSRRSRSKGQDPLHLVSAFAAQYRLVVGQEAVADKSNEKTAIPALLETLALKGCVVTLDAMGTDPKIAKAIRDRGADYVLAVKDNQKGLAESIRDFFQAFQDAPDKTPHQQCETVDKAHGRLEVRRCYVFDQLDGLDRPQRWPDLACFAVVESERTRSLRQAKPGEGGSYVEGKTSLKPSERPDRCKSCPAKAGHQPEPSVAWSRSDPDCEAYTGGL